MPHYGPWAKVPPNPSYATGLCFIEHTLARFRLPLIEMSQIRQNTILV